MKRSMKVLISAIAASALTPNAKYQEILESWGLGEFKNKFAEHGWKNPAHWKGLSKQSMQNMGMKDGHIFYFEEMMSKPAVEGTRRSLADSSDVAKSKCLAAQIVGTNKAAAKNTGDIAALTKKTTTDITSVRGMATNTQKDLDTLEAMVLPPMCDTVVGRGQTRWYNWTNLKGYAKNGYLLEDGPYNETPGVCINTDRDRNAYLYLGTKKWEANKPMTFVAWVKPKKDVGISIMSTGAGNSDLSIGPKGLEEGEIKLMINTSNYAYSTKDRASIEPNMWHHIALVQTGTTRSVYVDGEKLVMSYKGSSTTVNRGNWSDPAGAMYIGKQNKNGEMSGCFASVAIYNVALNEDQLEKHRTCTDRAWVRNFSLLDELQDKAGKDEVGDLIQTNVDALEASMNAKIKIVNDELKKLDKEFEEKLKLIGNQVPSGYALYFAPHVDYGKCDQSPNKWGCHTGFRSATFAGDKVMDIWNTRTGATCSGKLCNYKVPQYYTQVYWVRWRPRHGDWRTLWRGDNDHWIIVYPNREQLGMYSNRSGGWRYSGYTFPLNNKWHFLAVTGHGSNATSASGTQMYYYSDNPANNATKYVGKTDRVVSGTKYKWVGCCPGNQAPGYMGEMWMYNKKLSTTEINQLYSATKSRYT